MASMRINTKDLRISEMDVDEVRSSLLIRQVIYDQNQSSEISDYYDFLNNDYKTNNQEFDQNDYMNELNHELWSESFCEDSLDSINMRKKLFCPIVTHKNLAESSYSSICNIDAEFANKTLLSINLLTIPNTHQNSEEKNNKSSYLHESKVSTVQNYMNFDNASSVIRSIEGNSAHEQSSAADPLDWSPQICIKKKEESIDNLRSLPSNSKDNINKSLELENNNVYNILITQNKSPKSDIIEEKYLSIKKNSENFKVENDSNYKYTPKKIRNVLFDSTSKSTGFRTRFKHSGSGFKSQTPKKKRRMGFANISVKNEYASNFNIRKKKNSYKSISFQSQ